MVYVLFIECQVYSGSWQKVSLVEPLRPYIKLNVRARPYALTNVKFTQMNEEKKQEDNKGYMESFWHNLILLFVYMISMSLIGKHSGLLYWNSFSKNSNERNIGIWRQCLTTSVMQFL